MSREPIWGAPLAAPRVVSGHSAVPLPTRFWCPACGRPADRVAVKVPVIDGATPSLRPLSEAGAEIVYTVTCHGATWRLALRQETPCQDRPPNPPSSN